MDKKVTYHEQTDVENTLRLRDVLKTLPPFCRDFFRAIEPRTTTKTRISYAYDIRIFFQFLLEQNPAFKDWSMDAFTVDILDQITAIDLEEYEEYLKVYQAGDKTETNGERGLKRKMSSLRSFYAYYFKREMIHTNPTVLVDVPKIHQKSIIRLEADEVALLLDYIEHGGDDLTGQKKVYYEKTKDRDLALVTLLLGTGVRVSECVGLDIEDVDFKNNGIKVTRKGGNEMVVYFGPEVEIRPPGYHHQENHPSQAPQYLRYRPVPGNRGYLPCSRCFGSQGRQHHQEALRCPGRLQTPSGRHRSEAA